MNKKTYLVCGATGDIGSAIVAHLLKENHQVIGFGRKTNPFPEQNDYQHIRCDFKQLMVFEKLIKTIVKENQKIDGIILAAGFGQFAEIEQFSLSQMQEIMNVNFLSQALIIKNVLPNLKRSSEGKIIAIASESALQGARKGSMYCASKFALRGFLQSLRAECTQANLAVSIINPGLVETKFFAELSFKPGEAKENKINIEQVVKTVAMILQMENNCVVEEINLQPLKKVIQKNTESL